MYSPRTLVAAYRAAREGYTIPTGEWTRPMLAPDEFREWFRGCLERKINAHDPRMVEGRKTSEEYRTELGRMRYYIGNRVVVDWVAPILGQRVKQAFHHRLRDAQWTH